MTKPAENLRVLEGGAEGTGRAPSEPPPDPLIGRTIDGRYLIEGVLGEGGMGLVYRATHAVLNKPLAVKVLRPDVSKDEEIITRFRQEAQSASAIGNEHIINISDFGTLADGSTYFVMEFLDGVDLTTAIEQKSPPMSIARAVHVARQLCHALGAAHDAGIVHRDLKPDNIYLIRRGQDSDFVKVLDFGIAKVGSGTRRLTKAGQVFGTPHYMSPEQCGGQGIDHRTDIYALGVILYEMVTGRVPFDADNLMGVLTKHMYELPVPPNSIGEVAVDCPPALEAIILKALQKSPADRYPTMAELAEDLGRLATGEIPNAVAEGVRRDPTGAIGLPTVSGPMATVRPRPLKWLPLALAGLLLAGAAIAGVVMFTGGQSTPPPPEPVAESPEPPATGVTEEVEPPDMVLENDPATVESAGSRETAKVIITSEPEGAEVWMEGELIGNTPVEIPRPEGDARRELRLRRARYEEQSIRISALTQESVHITLEPSRRTSDRRRNSSSRRRDSAGRMTRMSSDTAATPTPPPTKMATPMRRLPTSEVLDPWAG